MKKILFLLLSTVAMYGQVPADATPLENIQITNNTTDNSATKVNVQSTDGTINTISKSDLVNVVEVVNYAALPTTGLIEKLYVTKDTNKLYRWNGTTYVDVAFNDLFKTYSSESFGNNGFDVYFGDAPNLQRSARFYVNKPMVLNNSGGHGIGDYSTINQSSTGTSESAYASFDALSDMEGVYSYNHMIGFQSRNKYSGSGGVIDRFDAFTAQQSHVGTGTVNYTTGFHVYDLTGTGPITTNYGVKVENLVRGVDNYAIYTGEGKVRFGDATLISSSSNSAILDLVNTDKTNGESIFLGIGEKGYTSSEYGFRLTSNNITGFLNLKRVTNSIENSANIISFSRLDGKVAIGSLVGTGDSAVGTDSAGNLKRITSTDSRPYKVYTALLSQSGTNAPVATVLENTLGGTVVWTRNSTGLYTGTLTGVFTGNKTTVLITQGNGQAIYSGYGDTSTNYVNLLGHSFAGIQLDNLLNKTTIEIRVYN